MASQVTTSSEGQGQGGSSQLKGLPVNGSQLRYELVLVGFFLIGMGVVILFSPVSAGLKNFLGGVLAGAGVGLLVTEYIASLDRAERKRDHNQLVSRVGDLTETIKRLVRILGPQKVAVIGQT